MKNIAVLLLCLVCIAVQQSRAYSGTDSRYFVLPAADVQLRQAEYPSGPDVNRNQRVQKVTVSGFIRDASSGETLIGAGVIARPASDLDSKNPDGAVTNNFGFYTLTVPSGKTILTWSYVGCRNETQTIDLQKDTVINMALSQSEELSASRIISRRDAGIGSTYMGALEIPQEMLHNIPTVFGEQDVLKVIQLMPGIQSGMEGFSGIYVRGGNADENLMMLDGTALYNVSHMLGLLSVFTPEAVKKVTVYKGSFPARYGGRVSSIVDVRTNDGNAKKFHGSVSAGLLSEKLHFEGPVHNENTTYSFSARGMHTFLFDRIIKWAGSPANYAFYDINAKVTHRFGNEDRIYAGLYHGRDYFRYGEGTRDYSRFYGNDYEPYTLCEEDLQKASVNWGNTVGSLRWNHVFSNRLFSNISVYANRYGMTVGSYSKTSSISEIQHDVDEYKYRYKSMILDFGAKADFDWTPVPQHLVKFGGEYVRHAYRPETERVSQKMDSGTEKTDTVYSHGISPMSIGHEMSVYIEDDITAGSHFSFNPGLRLSLFAIGGKAYFSPEPRIAIKADIGAGWAIKASYSRMSQYVHQLTSGSLSLPTDLWVPITRNIKPVKSDIVSAGVYFNRIKGWEFSLEGYWKHIDNVLEYKDGKLAFSSSENWEENVAVGEGRSYGSEFYIQKTQGRTTGSFSYTLAWSDRIFPDGSINNGKRFPFVYDRRHTICANVNQKIGKRLDLSAVWTFMSGNWMTVPVRAMATLSPDGTGEYHETEYVPSRNNYKLPPSHRLDLNLNIHKQKRHGERIWSVGLYNAYGARNPNWTVFDYKDTDGQDTGNASKTVRVLRVTSFLMFVPSFSYTFKF